MDIKQIIKKQIQLLGYDITRYQPPSEDDLPADLSEDDKLIIKKVRSFTMTSLERLAALIDATRHISLNQVPGAVVECGVWRGGSMMTMLLTLNAMSDCDREVYLYDTFDGMSEPTDNDMSYDGVSAAQQLADWERGTGIWCFASIDDVRQNVFSTGYPTSNIQFVRGKVEDTIPKTLPSSIALLRLDTDWYESTKHELEHLFPLLHPKGVLIVDDYGHWVGARKAVDEYFDRLRGQYYCHRIDYTGRLIMRMCN